MKISGTAALNASPQQVWDAFHDPQVLQRCLPGPFLGNRVQRSESTQRHTNEPDIMHPTRHSTTSRQTDLARFENTEPENPTPHHRWPRITRPATRLSTV